MIESIIYWLGVAAAVAILIYVFLASIFAVALMIRAGIAKELKSVYDHYQLRRLMAMLKKRGADEVYKHEIKK